MLWKDIIAEVPAVGSSGDSTAPITGIEYDSRRVRPGSVFVAMKGGTTDGNRYIDKAIAAGALGIITDSSPTFDHLVVYNPEIPVLEVEHGRRALAEASAAFFGHPEKTLKATGITGTNGKTTTAFLIEQLLNAAARKTVLIGTIEYHVAGEMRPSLHTTPESRDLFELMAEGVQRGATELVTEVSTHALDQGRSYGVPFDVAVFTNLTRDHLDYHQTMDKYFAAKRLLFDGTVYPAPRVAVLNAHDPRTKQLAAAARRAGAEVRTYGIGEGDWRAVELHAHARRRHTPPRNARRLRRSHFAPRRRSQHSQPARRLHRRPRPRHCVRPISSPRFPTLTPVPGRFQPVDWRPALHRDRRLRAHRRRAAQSHRARPPDNRRISWQASSPSSAAAAIATAPSAPRWATPQARAATSSSPPATIPAPKIRSPSSPKLSPACKATGTRYTIEPDRTAAIHLALAEAKPGDIVLIAGKGHEKEQILADRTIPFDDAEVALSALSELGYR